MRWNSQSISAPYVDTFSGSHQSSMLASLLALLLHLEPDLHHLARLDVDLLRLLAERLVPDLDGLLARRHVLDLGRAAGVRDREERGRQDRHPAEHPAVHVAGELDDLGLLELLHHHLLGLRLRLVDGRVRGRVRMDVVQDVVGVLELEVARRHRGHVRHELAAVLVDRRLRHLRRALAVGTETTALARPLLPPTTTFSITASVPHFSVSLLTLSFSTTGAPLYVTVTSTVPPPCASTGPGRWTNRRTPATTAAARTAPSALRIALYSSTREVTRVCSRREPRAASPPT